MNQSTQLNLDLHEAAKNGDVESVKKAIANGANPNSRDVFDGTTPIFASVSQGNLEVTKVLLENGADVNHTDNNVASSALAHAAIAGNLDMVQLLVSKGAILGDGDEDIVNEIKKLGFEEILRILESCSEKNS